MKIIIALTLAFTTMANAAQVADQYSANDLAGISKHLSDKKERFASRELKRYGNHYTMLAYRATTGSAEIHEHEADLFVVQEGHAAILLGGKLLGGHLQTPGELRGSSIKGGEKRPLNAGDIIHIPAGLPHQILVTPGDPITYFVVKVTGQ